MFFRVSFTSWGERNVFGLRRVVLVRNRSYVLFFSSCGRF